MRFTPYNLKRRPDQTTRVLNNMQKKLNGQTLELTNGKLVIIIGVQPDGSFGIKEYELKGDRRVEVKKVL